MDEQQFDTFVKRVASTSRRQVLGSLLAGLGVVSGAHEASAEKRNKKRSDPKGRNEKPRNKDVGAAAKGKAKKCGGEPCGAGNTCLKGSGKPVCCPNALVCGQACLAAVCASPCQVCDPTTGACINADGVSCNDGNPCTENDSCQAGVCAPGTPKVCPAPAPCKAAGVCNTTTGDCDYADLPNNTVCGVGQICCDGVCTNASTNENCGACGVPCTGTNKSCVGGQCVCTNTCSSPRVLNTSTCACECPATSCPEGQTLDPDTCTCGLRCINTCRPNGNEGSHCDTTTGLCTCDEGLVVCPGGGASNGSEFICCPPGYTCCYRPCGGGGVFDGCCPSGVSCGSPECINRFTGQC